MSDTQQATEAPYTPSESLGHEENEDATQPLQQAPEPSQEANGEAEHDDPARTERRREAARIGRLTRQKYEEKARADNAEREAAALREQLRGMQNPGTPQSYTEDDVRRQVDQLAEQKLAAREHDQRVNAWDKAGAEQFGQEKFREACKTVAELASDEQRQRLLSVALDVEGGQRAVMELAGNVEEAERVLALPPHRMALELAKLGAAAAPEPRRVSQLPPPIRPPSGGRARGEPDPERGSMADFERWSDKQRWRR